VLGGCPQAVRQLLEKTRLDRVLVAYATAAEAVASFGAKD
jgi:anti-anti-sigma regulatory factor